MTDIEVVIKIQKHDKVVIDRFVNGEGFEVLPTPIVDKVIRAVRNGTPLPKGHGDLIDVNRKITVSTYDEQYEEWGEETMTVLEALNKWSDEGVRAEDIIIPADRE